MNGRAETEGSRSDRNGGFQAGRSSHHEVQTRGGGVVEITPCVFNDRNQDVISRKTGGRVGRRHKE